MLASSFNVRLDAELDWDALAERLGAQLDAHVVAHPPDEKTNGGSLVVDVNEHVELMTGSHGVGVVSYNLSLVF